MKYEDEYKYNFCGKIFSNMEILEANNNLLLLYDKDDKLYRIAEDTKDIYIFKTINNLTGFKTKSIAYKHYKEKIRVA